MPPVVCAVHEPASQKAVRAAIDFSRDHGAELRLVGVVEDKLRDSTRATGGERVRRRRAVDLELDRGAAAARAAGVVATTTVRVGDVRRELVREAEAEGAGELFFVRTRGPLRAALTRQPRAELVHLSLGRTAVAELARAA
jgi:nucleotide-binding universal stress UspA family protein